MPWGAKKKSTEPKLEVSANLRYTISSTHSCIQKLEINPAILPSTKLTEDFVKPNPGEVSANLCCTILMSHSCIQKLESKPTILPATMLTENFVKPNPEVR